jgi:uncharacterized protein YjbI with pentapeptide repeats/beta-lactamase regulating signal transducer with metallopeptidase domain
MFDSPAALLLVILLNGLWQGAAIAALTWIALQIAPRTNAATRYAAWTLALLAAVVLPVLTSLAHVRYEHQHSTTAAVRTSHVSGTITESHTRVLERPVSAPRGERRALPEPPSFRLEPPHLLMTGLFALWAIAALALVVRLALALARLEKMKADALPLGMTYREKLAQWQQNAGAARDVRICVTDEIDVPVAVGLFDAMVLLPKHLLDALDAEEIDQISLHELAHLLRHDDWSNAFQRVVSALLFFNPAVWFIARQMDIEREVACDDYVLQLTGAVRTYAYCLTKMAEMTSWPHQPLAAPGVFVTRKSISIRIERLLRTGRAISSTISPLAAATVLGGLAVAAILLPIVTPAVAFAFAQATAAPAVSPPAVARTPRAPASARPAIAAPRLHVEVPAQHIKVDVPAEHIAVTVPTIHVDTVLPKAIGCNACDFSGARLPGKDFRNQRLAGSDFAHANLRDARFDRSDLSGTAFNGADLTDASFRNADLSGCDLRGATLTGANFSGAHLAGCSIDVRSLAPSQTRAFLRGCTGCDFAYANLDGMDLRGMKLIGTDLRRATLRHADLSGASFTGVDFTGVDFTGANLDGTTFSGCDFDKADLRHVDLRRAYFTGTSLRSALMN